MNRLTNIILLLIAVILTTACHKDEPQPPKPTPRSVLVYMVANNSLNANVPGDMTEMIQAAQAGDFGRSRLLVYQHRRNAAPVLLEVTAEGVKEIKTYSTDHSSVESARMLEAVADFKEAAPALNYGIVLWSHGSGWLQNGIDDTLPPVAELSFAQDGSKWMNVTTLAATLERCGFDYIYFDCCYMAGIEVMYQMRRCAPVIVASATELRADGMPYHLNLKYLLAENADLMAAAKSTFDFYDQESGSNRTCTMSVIRTESIEQLASLTREIYRTSKPLPEDFAPQRYMTKNCYLFDFRQYVEAICTDDALLAEWRDAFDRVVPYRAATPMLWNEIPLDHHSGLSTYILKSADDSNYRNYNQLDWWKDVAHNLFFRDLDSRP